MRAFLFAGVALALSSAGAASAQTAPTKSAPAREQNQKTDTIGEAVAALERGDCARALRLSEPVVKAGTAGPATGERLVIAYSVATNCKLQAGDVDTAYRYAFAATALPLGNNWLWSIRLGLELDRKQWAEAVTTVETMARSRPEALAAIDTRWLHSLNRELQTAHEDGLRRRLLAIVTAPAFVPDNPAATLDWLRQSYAELLLAAGDTAGARAQIGEIVNSPTLRVLSFDTRFRAMLPADLDLRAAVERDLAHWRSVMTAHPELLAPVNETAAALRDLGRLLDALALLESVRSRIEGKREAFADAGDQANWWWDGVARTNARLGRIDDAVTAFRAGAAMGEGGGLNVSQVINLAEAQNRANRPQDALATLAVFDGSAKASPYGFAEMREARGCANYLAGNASAAAADLAYLRAHDADNRSALPLLLLCMNDIDGAAASFIARLDDPEQRGATLADLSDYDPSPVAIPPDPTASKLPALKARPDVQAAIARAGGIRRIHLQRSEL